MKKKRAADDQGSIREGSNGGDQWPGDYQGATGQADPIASSNLSFDYFGNTKDVIASSILICTVPAVALLPHCRTVLGFTFILGLMMFLSLLINDNYRKLF